MMHTLTEILFLIICIFISGYISAAEISLFSLSKMKVRSFLYSSHPRQKRIAELLQRPRDLLVTILMINTATNILTQNLASGAVGDSSGWLLKVGLPLMLSLIFGEIIPKVAGIEHNTKLALITAPSVSFLNHLVSPLRRLITSTTSVLSRLLFFFLKKNEDISIDELHHALETSAQDGVLDNEEADLIRGYLELQELIVKELMRPREEMITFDVNEPIEELISCFVEKQCTRIPVYEGTIDNILGVISARMFLAHRHQIGSSSDVRNFLRKPFYVPETTTARVLLRQFEDKNEVLALVVDEYGAVAGLVTREDIVEVVVGEIQDLRDLEVQYTSAGDHVIIATGKLELDEFNKIFGVELVSENNMVTIGGWLTEQLGSIPKTGTNYTTKEFLFHILAADPNRIRRVYIRRLIAQAPQPKPHQTKE